MDTVLSRTALLLLVTSGVHFSHADSPAPARQAHAENHDYNLVPEGVIELPEPVMLKSPTASKASVSPAPRISLASAVRATSNVVLSDHLVPKISFDLPPGTQVSDQYAGNGIVFAGSGPKVIEDGDSPDSPVLSGTPDFNGDITGHFVDRETGDPSFVYAMTFTIGGLDEIGSVRIQLFDPDGQLISESLNSGKNFWRRTAFGGNKGIASWRLSNVSDTMPDGFALDDLIFTEPGVPNLGEELGIVDCSLGNPINPAVGNKYQVEVDYEQLKPFPLKVQRTYNSLTGSWQFLPELKHTLGSSEVQVVRGDGKHMTFTDLTDIQWVPLNPANTGTLSLSTDSDGEFSGWVYRTLDGERQFYDTTGRIARVEQRYGVYHDYSYELDAITVTHSLGGTLVYDVDTQGRITGFQDPDGYRYSYNYNSDGMISALQYPVELGSLQRLYEYQDPLYSDLLTAIRIQNANRTYLHAAWTYDEQRRATSSTHADDVDRTRFNYAFLDHPDYPQIRVTNALDRDTIYHFIEINGVRKTYAVQGLESANCLAANRVYGYYNNGFLYSSRDWNNNLTTHTRNARGQELSRMEAVDTDEQRTINTQWHSEYNVPTSISRDGQLTTFSYDGNGNLIQKRISDTSTP